MPPRDGWGERGREGSPFFPFCYRIKKTLKVFQCNRIISLSIFHWLGQCWQEEKNWRVGGPIAASLDD